MRHKNSIGSVQLFDKPGVARLYKYPAEPPLGRKRGSAGLLDDLEGTSSWNKRCLSFNNYWKATNRDVNDGLE